MILWTCLCMYPNVFLKNPNRSPLHWSDWLLVWYLVLFCVGLTEKFKCFFTEDIKHGIMSPICNILTACDFFTKAYYVSYAYWTHATYMYVRSWFRRLVRNNSAASYHPGCSVFEFSLHCLYHRSVVGKSPSKLRIGYVPFLLTIMVADVA